MPVPFADLQLQYQTIKAEIDGAIANVIRDNAFIRGPYVDAFEREFASRGRRAALRLLRQRHRRALSRDGRVESEARRRGHHHRAFLDLDLGDDHPCRRDAGILRHRRIDLHHRSCRDRSGDHAAHGRHHSGASLRPAGRHGRDHGNREQAQALGDRGLRAGASGALQGPAGRHASGRPRPIPSIPARISARWATPAPSSPTTRRWPST